MKKTGLSLGLSLVLINMIGCSPNQQEGNEGAVTPKSAVTRSEEAFPNQRGPVKTAYLNGQKISYQLINGESVFGGDMLLNPADLQDDPEVKSQGTGRSRASSRWPGKVVYYTIDPSLANQARVTSAIAHWQANTPIQFIQRTTQAAYVTFRTGTGCSSTVGYTGTQQFVNLATGCSTGNTIHEIGHTIGLWHEHTRADRNTYVTVNLNNVTSGAEGNFQTYVERGYDGFDYQGGLDFGSVMLYSSYDFSNNGQPTITRKDGSTFTGQRNGLSATDVNTVNYMYP